MLQVIFSLGGKTDKHFTILVAAQLFENIGRGFEIQYEVRGLLFDFLRGDRFWTEVQGSGGLDHRVRVRYVLQDGTPHFFGGSNTNRIRKIEFGWTGNK